MIPRVYVDTSVIGGCLDEEFASESRALLEMAENGKIMLLLSELLVRELEDAPPEVRAVLTRLAPDTVERLFINEESERLLAAYLRAKVVGSQHANDAHHVAIATVARADVILSWNFKHIVHWDRIRMFNAVNLREGYPIAEIRSPKEFV
jgi:predicted nucleic acid-binding protein